MNAPYLKLASPALLEAAVTLAAWIEGMIALEGEAWLEKQAPALQQAYSRTCHAINLAVKGQ